MASAMYAMAQLRLAPPRFMRRVIHTLSYLPKPAVAQGASPVVTVAEKGNKIELSWDDGRHWRFHSTWLRHNCQCSECLSPQGQKTWQLFESYRKAIASGLRVGSAQLRGDLLHVNWEAGHWNHNGQFPIHWLQENNYCEEKSKPKKRVVAETLPEVLYSEVMNSDEGHWKMLKNIDDYGMCLVKDVPVSEDSVRKVAERSGPVQGSVRFGEVYSVISKEDGGIDISYTNSGLPLHVDQSYAQFPLGIMVLHCLRIDSSVVGGESVLLDSYPIVEELRKNHPLQFDVLTKTQIRLKNRMVFDNGLVAESGCKGSHIELDQNGEFKMIRLNPPFECAQNIPEDEIEGYYKAYNLLLELVLDSDNKIVFQMQPGDLYIVNNYRVLHGREPFTLNGGERKLMGLYQSFDDYALRLAMVNKKLTKSQPPKFDKISAT